MSMNAPHVAAVVVAWNRAEILRDTLEALAQQSRPLDDLIVVNNASTDHTADVIGSNHAVTDVVVMPENMGGAGGFAAGIARAVNRGADLVWIMDDDTVPHTDALENLLEARTRYPGEPAILACRADWIDGREHPMNKPRRRVGIASKYHAHANFAKARQIRTASFVAIMIDARAVREDGLPQAAYFLWNDDFEYTGRLLRRRIGLYVDSARVEHRTKTFGNSSTNPGARFVNEVRNKIWALGSSRSFGPFEKSAFIGMTLLRWSRLLMTAPNRSELLNYMRQGIAQARTAPTTNEQVLAHTPVAHDLRVLAGVPDAETPQTHVAESCAGAENSPSQCDTPATPDFSVLLPVYINDNPDFFKRSLRSVGVEQTLQPSQIVIVCDGPVNQRTDQIISSVLEGTASDLVGTIPVTVVRLAKNRGLATALNAGLMHCVHDIVARADSDDISTPERFEKQIAAITQGFDIVGSAIAEFTDDEDQLGMVRAQPESSQDIARAVAFHDPFNHPAVMFRARAVRAVGGYQHLDLMEDYWLFARMVKGGARSTNLPDVLVKYRVGAGAYERRGGLRLLRSETELQHRLNAIGVTSLGQYLRNVVVRGGYRLLPTCVRRAGYRIWRRGTNR